MKEIATDTAAAVPDALYGAEYYHSHCGDAPYAPDSPEWLSFYSRIADEIVRSLRPGRVFDAGCAVGFLVSALWDRNVETHGRDISSYAISQVRAGVREYCSVGSITAPIDGDFDLILCVEVLEHMPEQEALEAISVMTRAAPRILFSSTPSDFDEPTHVNVRPTLYWLRQFANAGFAPVVRHDATYLCPHAMLLELSDDGRTEDELVAFAEIVRQRLFRAEETRHTAEVTAKLAALNEVLASDRSARLVADSEWKARLDAAEHRSQELEALGSSASTRVARQVRRLSRVAWWAVTLQLPRRLRVRRQWLSPHLESVNASTTNARPPAPAVDAGEAVRRRFAYNEPLRTYAVPGSERRLSVVTDSIGEGFLYGGVGTTLIMATLLARRMDCRLRLITRTQPADVQRIRTVLEAQGLEWSGDIEVVHAPPTSEENIPLGAGDFFLTTSWWTTLATLQSVPARNVIYLLQEDERMFYPRCDDRLRCAETLARGDLHIVVNSQLLFDHLDHGPEPLPGLQSRAHWFEPAFPSRLFHRDRRGHEGDKRGTFFFYARPNNLRNLYWRGLEAISVALEEGVLDPELWTFLFVGKDIEGVVLPGGIIPTVLQNLPWDRYADVVRSVDLGLALMDTPHASYPPLDLAASGAVVVTNTCGIKQSLERYSRNIITVPTEVDALCRGLAKGVALSSNASTRLYNLEHSGFERDWQQALESTIRACVTWIEG
jgi:SAM-dependent methyltransferase